MAKAKKAPSKVNTVSQSKRRITKPGGFNIPGFGNVNEGDEVTNEMRAAHEAWQKLNDGENKLNDYTS